MFRSIQRSKAVLDARQKRRRGFTLFEVMLTLSMTSVVMAGSMSFVLQSLNTYHYDMGKLMVNRDIRTFTSEMTENAAYANYFMIFPSFEERSNIVEVGDSENGFVEVELRQDLNGKDRMLRGRWAG